MPQLSGLVTLHAANTVASHSSVFVGVQDRFHPRCCGPKAELDFLKAEVCRQPNPWWWLREDCHQVMFKSCQKTVKKEPTCGAAKLWSWTVLPPLLLGGHCFKGQIKDLYTNCKVPHWMFTTSGNAFKTDQSFVVSEKTDEYLIYGWKKDVFQSVVVVGIFPLTNLWVHSAAHSFVPNRDDCKWLWGTTDGWWTAWTHETSVHLVSSKSPAVAHSLQRDSCLHVTSSSEGSLSAGRP